MIIRRSRQTATSALQTLLFLSMVCCEIPLKVHFPMLPKGPSTSIAGSCSTYLGLKVYTRLLLGPFGPFPSAAPPCAAETRCWDAKHCCRVRRYLGTVCRENKHHQFHLKQWSLWKLRAFGGGVVTKARAAATS